MASGFVRVNIDIDVLAFNRTLRGFIKAMDAAAPVVQVLSRAVETMSDALHKLGMSATKYHRMATMQMFGPDNETQAGEWQSDACASWLHDSCRGGALCVCRCHR